MIVSIITVIISIITVIISIITVIISVITVIISIITMIILIICVAPLNFQKNNPNRPFYEPKPRKGFKPFRG